MVKTNSFRNLSNSELQAVLLICEQLHHAEPEASFVHHCHVTLHNALSNVHFSAELYQLDPVALKELEQHTLDNGDYWLPLFREHILEHPYAQRMPALAEPEINMTQREPTLKNFYRSTLFNEFYDQIESQNQIWVGLRDGSELLNCIYSRDREYSEAHLAMLCLIQPHLETAWKNWKRTRRLQQELGVLKEAIFQSEEEEFQAARLRKSFEALTSRQRDVVELVAAGMDNQQISNELKISILTVKKHMQTIFQSLEVQHRTQLAAKWHQGHSVSIY